MAAVSIDEAGHRCNDELSRSIKPHSESVGWDGEASSFLAEVGLVLLSMNAMDTRMIRQTCIPGLSSMSLLKLLIVRFVRDYLASIGLAAGRAKFPDIAAYSRDYITLDIMSYGYWEINEIETLKFLVQRFGFGGIFIDIGANIGCYSLGIGESFKKTLAFEPCHENFSLLTHNLRFNMSTPYSAHQIALGSQHGRVAIDVNKANRGGARVSAGIAKNTSPGDNIVEVFTLDEFLANHVKGIHGLNVDLLKIDVEGYEAQVIEGSLKAIESYQPVVAFEFTSNDNFDYSHFSLLEELGYTFMILKKGRTGVINRLYAPLGLPYFLTPAKVDDIIARNRHVNLVYAIPSRFLHLLG